MAGSHQEHMPLLDFSTCFRDSQCRPAQPRLREPEGVGHAHAVACVDSAEWDLYGILFLGCEICEALLKA